MYKILKSFYHSGEKYTVGQILSSVKGLPKTIKNAKTYEKVQPTNTVDTGNNGD